MWWRTLHHMAERLLTLNLPSSGKRALVFCNKLRGHICGNLYPDFDDDNDTEAHMDAYGG